MKDLATCQHISRVTAKCCYLELVFSQLAQLAAQLAVQTGSLGTRGVLLFTLLAQEL